jgi:cytochrome c553
MKTVKLAVLMLLASVSMAPVAVSEDAPAAGSTTWNEGGGEQEEALKLTPNLENGRDVYEVCSACHQPNGWGLVDGTFPQIAGQHRDVLIKQLADIRALNRDNPTMYPFALPQEIGGPQSIADVTAYIAKLPMNPNNGVGPGTMLDKGKQLYADNCVRCHGDQGQGDDAKYYPRIQGQHYEYLLRQYKWIKEGKRRNANPDMVKQIQNFTDEDTVAVLDYVSRLKPPAEMLGAPDWVNPDFE